MCEILQVRYSLQEVNVADSQFGEADRSNDTGGARENAKQKPGQIQLDNVKIQLKPVWIKREPVQS